MIITSPRFLRGITGPDPILTSPIPQVAFVGRSNVGKSSIINTLLQKKGLAITSNTPGRTREINLYSANDDTLYILDLPGYGYASGSHAEREQLQNLIHWYILESGYVQKYIIQVIDAAVGPTENDIMTLRTLEQAGKDIVIVANKVDKIRPSDYKKQMDAISKLTHGHRLIPYSAEKKISVIELQDIVFGVKTE
jgi:GTP-binding protein